MSKSTSDLSCCDLSGSDLSGSYLNGSDLSGSYLSGSYLNGSDLNGSDLNGSDLNGSDLNGSDLNGSLQELVESSEAQQLVESTWGLRLRTQIRSLNEEDSTVVPPTFEELANYKPITEKLNEMYFQSMFGLLRFFMLTLGFLQTSWTVLSKTSRAVRDSFRDEMYVFFEGSSHPYRLATMLLDSPGVPAVEWYYNATTTTFVTARLQTNSQHYTTHHIPYLSAQIQYNDLTLYDISEFMESVHWAGEEGEPMPNVDHLVSAWSLSSGIVLRRSSTMRLSVINTDGNDAQIPLRNQA